MQSIERRRKIRALEAKRDALLIKKSQVTKDLAAIRVALKHERGDKPRRRTAT